MRSTENSYLLRLDHLRFFAAFLVFGYHAMRPYSPAGYVPKFPLVSLLHEGHSGVALFIVLSGFVFSWLCYEREVDYKNFLFNRFVRIYPLYLFCVFIAVSFGRTNTLEALARLLFSSVSIPAMSWCPPISGRHGRSRWNSSFT